MARHARSFSATKARPGGHISPFCEPATTASTPQASIGHGTTPREDTVSTTSSVSVARVSPAYASMSSSTPVEVSLWVARTTRAPGWARRAAASRSGATVSPYGASRSRTVTPNARQTSSQRSPNLPQRITIASSPGDRRFTTAASIAPVPEAARTSTSLRVSSMSASAARTRANSVSNSGVRWWRMGRDRAWSTSGGIGVGPGARRWYFFIQEPPLDRAGF